MASPDSRRGPFAVAAVVLVVVTTAVFALPVSLIDLMQRDGLLEGAQADWTFRLLVVAAVGQAAYGGFFVLRPERVAPELRPSAKDATPIPSTIARNAAGMTCLTLVYGIAAFALTGLRNGFWLFVGVAVAQGSWYFRSVGLIANWLRRLPQPPVAANNYCPPLARALIAARPDTR